MYVRNVNPLDNTSLNFISIFQVLCRLQQVVYEMEVAHACV